MNVLRMVITVGLASIAFSSAADEMFMKNGSKLVGTLVRAENDMIVFDTPFAGEISVKDENVERVATAEAVIIVLDDGTIYRDRTIDVTQTGLIATAVDQNPVEFAPTDIKFINPEPWRLGEGYDWTGTVSTAFEAERGNSDTDEWDIAVRSTWLSLKNRFTFRGELEYDEANNVKTNDNWETRFKYDRFRGETTENYLGGKLYFKYDRFADLDLRTTIGPHIGRHFFQKHWLDLKGEIGPVWVDEQFDMAEDNDFPGALWELAAESDILGFGTTLYAMHDGTLNFDEADDLILNTRVGVRLPKVFGLETGVEARYEYDGGAVDGVDDTDETYTVNIAYVW